MDVITFRGFAVISGSDEKIKLGDEIIKGTWWTGVGVYRHTDGTWRIIQPATATEKVPLISIPVLKDTITHSIMQDERKFSMFVGDRVKSWVSADIPHGEVIYDPVIHKYLIGLPDGGEMDIDEYKPVVIGTRWDVQ